MTERILVPFTGEGSGVERLSWGQRELWGGMQRQNTWMPLASVQRLPVSATVDDVVAEMRFAVERYPSMRTRLRLTADGPRQVLASSGAVPLDIVDVAGDADPAVVAEQVRQRYWDADYDFENEWPVRTAVIRHRGALTHRVDVMCHLVTDAFGAMVMLDELAEWRATGQVAAPPAAMQPLRQAQWQHSPAGQRQCAQTLRYWEGLLRTIPARRFPGSTDRRQPRHWRAGFTSRALHLAVQAIAARTDVAAATVLVTVFAVALGQVTGIDPVVARVVVSNRFRPGLADTVSPLTQTALLVLDVGDTTMDDVVARTQRRAFAAYKHAYYDPAQIEALVERVGRERGEEIDVACFFNDRRLAGRDTAAGPVPTAEDVRSALPETTFRWEGQSDDSSERLFVHVNDVPDTVDITIFADTHHLAPADLEACVRGMEEVAVAAATSTQAPAVGAAASRPAGTRV